MNDHWKIRLGFEGYVIHVASSTEPRVLLDGGRFVLLDWTPIEDTELGDTVGYIDWTNIKVVTWRFHVEKKKLVAQKEASHYNFELT